MRRYKSCVSWVPFKISALASLLTFSGTGVASPVIVNGTAVTVSNDMTGTAYRVTNNGTVVVQSGGVVGDPTDTTGTDSTQLNSGSQLTLNKGSTLLGALSLSGGASANIGKDAGSGLASLNNNTLTTAIIATDSNLSIDAAKLTGGAGSAKYITLSDGATLTTTANTVIDSSAGIGDALELTGIGSSATVTGSTISGGEVGVRAEATYSSGTNTAPAAMAMLDHANVSGKRSGILLAGDSAITIHGGTVTGLGTYTAIPSLPGIGSGALIFVGDGNNSLTIDQGAKVIGSTSGLSLLTDATQKTSSVSVSDSMVQGQTNGISVGYYPGGSSSSSDALASSSTINLKNTAITGVSGSAIDAQSGTTTVNVSGSSKLSGGNGTLLSTSNGATVNLNLNGVQQAQTGDIINLGGVSNVSLTNANWLGGMSNGSSLTMNGGGIWSLAKSSSVNQLVMNGGVINLNGVAGTNHTLNTGSLSGSGNFILHTNLASNATDKLVVTGQATGSHTLTVADTGVSSPHPQNVQVVQTGGGNGNFVLANGKVDLGMYSYVLQQDGTNWDLVVPSGPVKYTASATSVLNLVSTSPTIWYGQVRTLQSRLGELRFEEDHGGVWARPYASDYRIDGVANSTFHQRQTGIAIGADKGITLGSGKAYLGGVFNYSASSLDNNAGASGDVDVYSLGAYGVWLAPNGLYLHGLVSLNQYHNRGEATMSNGVNTSGSYHQNGVGASLEAGKRFQLKKDWFVQPYVQVAGVRMNGATVALDNGLQAQSNHVESLQGSIGTSFGKLLHTASGGTVEPYVRLAVTHEFVKNNTVMINGSAFDANLNGSRVEVGLGASGQINKRLSAHIDYSYAKGPVIEKPFMIDAGLRYQW
ncbi:autotransporter outer membrane beta-barrel domain-containing protein [Chromobacterium vaccinii]|uniref:autotransporter outer membrane beta-barrel domain-containing protein n=1 Tax=Chromobacterium vaccinii TaxID=1108595 RepID=UPI003C72E846